MHCSHSLSAFQFYCRLKPVLCITLNNVVVRQKTADFAKHEVVSISNIMTPKLHSWFTSHRTIDFLIKMR